ncbi:EF-hand domain-containing protein [Pseudoalteromonas sp. NEC-BIFX-2020_002]|uniref:Calcium-binding protein n=2 Tax=Pseudoalteromonas TaxID=53246 RepID=A0A0N0M0Z9_9GAMM|nr:MULTISPECIES: EF-hand domain-containing protein [Pseudoalteromonas]KPH64658.1 calcium-binding protein [Pseudoalteromonas porphyrae]NNG43952.1 EF-hand domain-containing protein [Pseudoalteromonas sp. NEC-BIFX-2020_002]
MKSLSAIALLTVLCVTFTAQVAAKKEGKPPPRPDFSTIDSDGSGGVDFNEFSAQKRPPGADDIQMIFDEIDADKNGEISKQEFKNHKPPQRQRKGD